MTLLNPKICHLQRWVDILRVMLFYYTQGSHGAALLRLYLRHHCLTFFFFFEAEYDHDLSDLLEVPQSHPIQALQAAVNLPSQDLLWKE